MAKIIISIEGMSCNHCKMAVGKVLSGIEGLQSWSVNLKAGEAEIEGNPDLNRIISEISKIGYWASVKN